MYAIVDIAGQQMKVEKGKKLFVARLEGEKGASLDFTKVLLTDDNGSVKVGTPYVDGVNVKTPQRLSEAERSPPVFNPDSHRRDRLMK